jgi:hypothetical protein
VGRVASLHGFAFDGYPFPASADPAIEWPAGFDGGAEFSCEVEQLVLIGVATSGVAMNTQNGCSGRGSSKGAPSACATRSSFGGFASRRLRVDPPGASTFPWN